MALSLCEIQKKQSQTSKGKDTYVFECSALGNELQPKNPSMCLTSVRHGLVISVHKRVSMKQADNNIRVLAKTLSPLTAIPPRTIIVTSQTLYSQAGLTTQAPVSRVQMVGISPLHYHKLWCRDDMS